MASSAQTTSHRPVVVASVIVVALLVIAGAGASNHNPDPTESSSSSTAETNLSTREFRNNEYLAAPQPLPDISHLAEKFRDKAKYGYLVAMLDVWKPTLLSSNAYRTTKGKIDVGEC